MTQQKRPGWRAPGRLYSNGQLKFCRPANRIRTAGAPPEFHVTSPDGTSTYWAERWGWCATCPPCTTWGVSWCRLEGGCDREIGFNSTAVQALACPCPAGDPRRRQAVPLQLQRQTRINRPGTSFTMMAAYRRALLAAGAVRAISDLVQQDTKAMTQAEHPAPHNGACRPSPSSAKPTPRSASGCESHGGGKAFEQQRRLYGSSLPGREVGPTP